ncbi:DNA gyrase C-terminal beta-propeller domain-containing protein [Candidatus Mycoplasma haematominutum]|uniref:DNA gyrase subunit A n=1 Tax=Candidatus Mycoplasma haematominutum 'Birmingham 1' TaxID=1116213 RepID=G8C2J6_9MOLU|nr:DNA gyrase C-terminal beta-propeller domain-containing protein [Candidatus Mycoplasma haematominutum]CCE66544.1 DNA gyrase subunit A, fragment [Candidatus Mycoplasma haematominutum 'Birmingham 1']
MSLERSSKIISVSTKNYLAGIFLRKIRSTKRGRVGLDVGGYPNKDVIANLTIAAENDDAILLFTNIGKVYKLSLDDEKAIVVGDDSTWPEELVNIPELLETNSSAFEKNERVVQLLPIKNEEFEEDKFFFMSTEKGMVKKLEISELSSITRAGKRVITLFEGDSLSHVIKIGAEDEVLLGLSTGYAVRFSSTSVRASGRASTGVKSIEIEPKSGAKIISLSSTSNPTKALVVSIDEEGKGKCTSLREFRLTSRRSKGTIAYKLGLSSNSSKLKKGAKKLSLVTCAIVHDNEELVLLSDKNRINRIGVDQVTLRRGRNTAGTILVRLEQSGEKLFQFAKHAPSEV